MVFFQCIWRKEKLSNLPILLIIFSNSEYHHQCLRAGEWGENKGKRALEH